MRLQRLVLENFKGIRDFTFEPGGADATIFGDNAAGKTSIVDAWMWLLFGKDSLNRAQFDIKTLTPAGEPLHNLEHRVEGIIDLGAGELLTLSKVLKENWTRKRGSSQAEFTGHTTDHFIDGVPVLKKEFDERVRGIAEEGTFRLLTDPAFFNTHLTWQERRETLLRTFGNVSQAEVIDSNQDLTPLTEILGKRTVAEHRKVIASRRAELNKQLTTLPARIDEVHKGIPELPASTSTELQAVIDDLTGKRTALEAERSRIQSGGEAAELQRQLAEVRTSILDVERRVRAGVDEQVVVERQKLAAIEAEDDEHRVATQRATRELQDAEARLERVNARLALLREDYARIASQKAPEHTADTCSACGQGLPAEQVQAAHEKALAAFNKSRAQQLEENQAEGRKLKAERDELTAHIPHWKAEQAARAEKTEEIADRAAAQRDRIKTLQANTPDPTSDPEHAQLTAQVATLTGRLEQLRSDSSSALETVATQLTEVDAELTELRSMLALFDQHDRALARITELEEQELQLNREHEQLERESWLLDEFIKTEVSLLESRINRNFKLVGFKLFNTLVNGAVEPTCSATVNGVPFESLNHGARINAGLDIISALQEHHGFAPPIFIDNSESVTQLQATSAQTIRLVVSAGDKTLRIESAQEALAS